MSLKCTMILGDCLDVMPNLPGGNIHFGFADLPYGSTARNQWDVLIPLHNFIPAFARCCCTKSTWVFTSDARLSSRLIAKLGDEFRYDLVWDKRRVSGFLNAKKSPMRRHEWIIVAGKPGGTYHPIHTQADANRGWGHTVRSIARTTNYGAATKPQTYVYTDKRLPTSILTSAMPIGERGRHPTQKPVALLDWLIRTYSNADDLVLDPVSGSGTTACAALLSGRNVVCIERDKEYHSTSVERVRETARRNLLDVKIEVIT